MSAQKRFQLLSTAARPRGGGRREQCSCRRGREGSQCGCATLVLEHQRWLVRGAGNDVDGNHSRASQGQPQGLLSFGSLWGPVMSLCWCGSSHTCCPQQGTSAPACPPNKAPRIPAPPLLLTFTPLGHWERAAQAVPTPWELDPGCPPATWAPTFVSSRRDASPGERGVKWGQV